MAKYSEVEDLKQMLQARIEEVKVLTDQLERHKQVVDILKWQLDIVAWAVSKRFE